MSSSRLELTNYFKDLVAELLPVPNPKQKNYFPLGKKQLSDATTSLLSDVSCVWVGYDVKYQDNQGQVSKLRTIGFYLLKRSTETEENIQAAFSEMEALGDLFVKKLYEKSRKSRNSPPELTIFHTININEIDISEQKVGFKLYGYYYTIPLNNRI